MDTILFFLMSVNLLLGQLGRVSIGNGVQFYLLEIVIFAHIVWIILKYRKELASLRVGNIEKTTLFWACTTLLVLLVTSREYTLCETGKASLYLVRVIMFIGYAFLLHNTNVVTQKSKEIWVKMSISVPVICILQYIFLPDLRFLGKLGWDPHMYRAVGLIWDPPIVGSLLGIFLMYSLFRSQRIGVIFNYIAVIFLYSRSTYLAVLILVSLYLATQRKWLGIACWVVFFAVSVWLAPKTIPPRMNLESAKLERLSTVASRKTEVLAGLKAWSTSPFWGIGYNRVSAYKAKRPELFGHNISGNHASSAFHSFWVTQLATTGVLGVGLSIYGLYLVLKKNMGYVFLIGVPAIIGVFDNVLFHPFVMIVFMYASVFMFKMVPGDHNKPL